MSEETVRILLRIPVSLKTKLAELAEREHRSLNRQIEFMLDRSVQEKANGEADRLAGSKTDNRKGSRTRQS